MPVPPGYASPIWPPTGIALTALLIFGRKLWPGVLLGALANQFLAVMMFTEQLTISSLISSSLIALASTGQAVLASYLSARYVQTGLPKLDEPYSIFIFFLLAGPVACLLAASIGVASLVFLQIIPLSSAMASWANWWAGDILGVFIITPLGFCLFGKPRKLWRNRQISVALPLVGLLLALAIVFNLVYRSEQTRVQMAFDNQAATIDRILVGYADNVIDATYTLRDLFSVSKNVERNEFLWYSKRLIDRHPEIQALEWLPHISHDQLSIFEKSVQAEGFPNFHVIERLANGEFQPVSKKSEYFPILYVEPMQGNEKIFGYDSTSSPISFESKKQARETGKPSATQKMQLAQGKNANNDAGVLVSIPVNEHELTGNSGQLLGFVSSVILPVGIVHATLQNFNLKLLGISLKDLSAPAEQADLFFKPVQTNMGKNYQLKPWLHDFPFADRTWQLSIMPDNNFITEFGSNLPWITLTGGLFFTSLLTTLLLTISGKTAYVEGLVNERTLELAKANAELQASETASRNTALMLTTLIDSQPECVKLLAKDGSVLQMNRAGLDFIEADNFDQVLGQQVEQLVLPKYRKAFNELTNQVFAGQSGQLEFEITGLKGSHRWLDTHAVPMRDAEGNILALLGLTRDISKRKQSEQHLELASRVFNEAHEGILITDAKGVIIDVNPTFCDITGFTKEEVIGQNPRILKSDKQSTAFYEEMWLSLLLNKHWQGEIWNRKRSGELFAELLTISVLSNEDGQPSYYVGLFSDITKSMQQQEQLTLMAHYDPLTGLPNRVLLADRLKQAIARSFRESNYLAICFLDLDGFKPVNDQCGHDAGDQVLVAVAERLKHSLRQEDSVSRHGGDEFILLLGDLNSIEQCIQAIERIHATIAAPYTIQDQTIFISASTGITLYPLDNAEPDALLRHADQAMYQAKIAGKNRYVFFDAGENQQIMNFHKHLRAIEQAFLNNELCLYYQPKLNVQIAKIYGAEALLRWRHQEKGLISPAEFLPVLVSTELEIRIGNWVIAQAWQQLADWHQQGHYLEISVNISAFHLLSPGFFAHLDEVMQKHADIDSRFFQLEILESTALDDLVAVKRIIKHCHDFLGIRIALDDFGTGYASLTHFRHLAVDTIKIDQSFVRDMLDDPDDFAIIESVMGLSQVFGREVIAEGVENNAQGAVLVLLGCSLLQGYAIARPMSVQDFSLWLQQFKISAEWQNYPKTELTQQQIKTGILFIACQQWFKGVQDCLTLTTKDQPHWPIIEYGKSFQDRWLQQAYLSELYQHDWLDKINLCHRQLLDSAAVVKDYFDKNQYELAQAEFTKLQKNHQQLLGLITPS